MFAPHIEATLARLERSPDGLLLLSDRDVASIGEIAGDPRVAGARRLVARCELGPEGAEALAGSVHLRRLEQLDLAGARIGDAGLEALASSPVLASVERLRLGPLIPGHGEPHYGFRSLAALLTNDLSDAGFRALSTSPWTGSLTMLDLSASTSTDDGVAALVASPGLRSVVALNLFWTRGTTPAAGEIIGRAAFAERLVELDLSWCRLGDDGVRALARHVALARVERLILQGNRVGPEGAGALAASQTLRSVSELDLRRNRLGEEGVEKLSSRTGLARLTRLGLDDNGLSTGLIEPWYDQGARIGEGPEAMLPAEIQRRWFRRSGVSVF